MNSTQPLLGTWRLVAIRATRRDGSVEPEAYGPAPAGYITYTADGHMMVMFARGDRPALTGSPDSPFALDAVPDVELAQAFASFSAYAGTYTFDGNTVTHHVAIASIPNRSGTQLTRTAVFEGNRLTLQTPPQGNNAATRYELIWERAT